MNLIEKLGLEKCKEIVDGAPRGSLIYDLNSEGYYQCFAMYNWDILLSDIRTEIANHERTDTCSDIKNHISPNTKVIEG